MLKFLNWLALFTSVGIAGIAAYFSVIGMATIFAGAYLGTIVMMTALEVGKLVAASWLYHNWNSDVPRLLKSYLFGAIIILIFITSLGIFGFLSKAHLDQVKPTSGNNIKIELLDKQITQQNLIIERAEKQITLLDKAEADRIFRDINIEVNGFHLLNYLTYWVLRGFGFVAWNKHRKVNAKIK